MHDLMLGFLVACALCAVLVWAIIDSHNKAMALIAKYHPRYPLANGKSYYLIIEESEYIELQKAATTSDHSNHVVSGSSPARNRRVTDAWMHDPVPSESGFKRQGVANHEPVGWNDDY